MLNSFSASSPRPHRPSGTSPKSKSVDLGEEVLSLFEALREANERAEVDKVAVRLQTAMRKAFRLQGKPVSKKVKAGDPDWMLRFYEITVKTAPFFVGPIQKAAEQSLVIGANQAIAELGLGISFDLKNPRALAYLKDYGVQRVAKIDSTTQKYLSTLLQQSLDEGWSSKRTAAAIIERYEQFAIGQPQAHIESRAHLIAVTETGEAYSEANLMVAQDLQDAGITMEKAWSTVGDGKVSEGCLENEAKGYIGLNQEFPSGHQRPLRFPGCRCDMLTRRKK
jgi:hypothetical protein